MASWPLLRLRTPKEQWYALDDDLFLIALPNDYYIFDVTQFPRGQYMHKLAGLTPTHQPIGVYTRLISVYQGQEITTYHITYEEGTWRANLWFQGSDRIILRVKNASYIYTIDRMAVLSVSSDLRLAGTAKLTSVIINLRLGQLISQFMEFIAKANRSSSLFQIRAFYYNPRNNEALSHFSYWIAPCLSEIQRQLSQMMYIVDYSTSQDLYLNFRIDSTSSFYYNKDLASYFGNYGHTFSISKSSGSMLDYNTSLKFIYPTTNGYLADSDNPINYGALRVVNKQAMIDALRSLQVTNQCRLKMIVDSYDTRLLVLNIQASYNDNKLSMRLHHLEIFDTVDQQTIFTSAYIGNLLGNKAITPQVRDTIYNTNLIKIKLNHVAMLYNLLVRDVYPSSVFHFTTNYVFFNVHTYYIYWDLVTNKLRFKYPKSSKKLILVSHQPVATTSSGLILIDKCQNKPLAMFYRSTLNDYIRPFMSVKDQHLLHTIEHSMDALGVPPELTEKVESYYI